VVLGPAQVLARHRASADVQETQGEAELYERSGDLLAALEQYTQEALTDDRTEAKRAKAGVARVLDRIRRRVARLVALAQADILNNDYISAIDRLDEAHQYLPGDPGLFYDKAIVLKKLGDREKAVELLDTCIYLSPPGRRREDAEILRSQWSTWEQPAAEGHKQLDGFNSALRAFHAGFAEGGDPPGAIPCKQLETMAVGVTPAVLYDRAFCHEIQGKMESAQQEYSDYANAFPNATDSAEVRERLPLLASLASLNGRIGSEVRRRFGEATYYAGANRFDLAMQELREAEYLDPDYLETKKEIARLATRLGDVKMARAYYSGLLQHAETATDAEAAIDTIAWNQERYDDSVQQAAMIIGSLFSNHRNDDNPLWRIGARLDFQRALERLHDATSVFDLGADAHAILALAFQLSNNHELALRSMDVVYSHQLPIVFFTSEGKRVEIGREAVRILTVHPSWRCLLPVLSEGDECSTPDTPTSIPLSEITAIDVRESAIELYTADQIISLTPAQMGLKTVKGGGPLAREHANFYALVLRRYAGIRNVKFGPETISKKELLQIVGGGLLIALEIYSGFTNQDGQRWMRGSDALKIFELWKTYTPIVLRFVELVHERQQSREFPVIKLLPSRNIAERFITDW
jgi:tetratricopeptide (TPR) repeat protein